MRGVTIRTAKVTTLDRISTHTPHARRDLFGFWFERSFFEFQLTRLMRGVTPLSTSSATIFVIFQLTRLMRGVTRFSQIFLTFYQISTHTPHARRDSRVLSTVTAVPSFQLTRLMRGVTSVLDTPVFINQFQLTRLMRGVTVFVVLI